MVDVDPDRVESLMAGRSTWPRPTVVATTGSTNDDLEVLARDGAPEGTCISADEQTAGRGRLDRTWVSPPGSGLWVSILVRPGDIPVERLSWLPLVAGVAVSDALREASGVRAELKWPNDLVAIAAACGGSDGPRKLGGILSALVPDAGGHGSAVILGIGINVDMGGRDLPITQATSVLLEGGNLDRSALLAALLISLEHRLAQWRSGDGSVEEDYRTRCATIGRLVDVELPNGNRVSGVVAGIDDDGHLLVSDGESSSTITAGDVVHATI
jgi:BirA family biotin operon repressor/biotin-[acetyl-CoA-carboxylase] ligase